MKYRKVCCLLISILAVMTMNASVQAEELPVTVRLEYIESEAQVLVSIIASKPAVWEAYTLSVAFDKNVYQLYKGYDKLLDGYGYASEFEDNQGNAMMLSNALEDRVIFSGVSDSKENSTYDGVIARIVLLKYGDSQDTASDIWLEISALRVNGESIALTDRQIFYNGTVEMLEEGEVQTGMSENLSGAQSSSPLPADSMSPAKADTMATDTSEADNTDNTEITDNKTAETDNDKKQGTTVSAAVTKEAVLEEKGSSTAPVKTEQKESNSKTDSHKRVLVGLGIVLVICLLPGSVLLMNKKRKEE